MAILDNEKTVTSIGTDGMGASPEPTLTHGDVNHAGDSDSSDPEKCAPVKAIVDDEYPSGLKLVLLSAATLVAVFLIALDQVRTLPN
jgi:hypothetical protein